MGLALEEFPRPSLKHLDIHKEENNCNQWAASTEILRPPMNNSMKKMRENREIPRKSRTFLRLNANKRETAWNFETNRSEPPAARVRERQ